MHSSGRREAEDQPAPDAVPDRPLSVLFVHPAGAFGGASRSLLELLTGFPPKTVAPRVLVQRGQVAGILRAAGIPCVEIPGVSQFTNTSFGYYRGVRWLILLRELAYLPATVKSFWALRKSAAEIDLVHVNEITCLPAILCARWFLRKPIVTQVRSVQRTADSWVTRAVRRLLRRYVDAVIAIDDTVRRSLPRDVEVDVVHNAFNPGTLAAEGGGDLESRLKPRAFRVAMVGGLIFEKGVLDFIEAVRICRDRGLDIQAVMAGEPPVRFGPVQRFLLESLGVKRDMAKALGDAIRRHGLEDRVCMLGFTKDVQAVYRSIDVLCFPCHVEAIGRPVFEAAHYGKPSIATEQGLGQGQVGSAPTGLSVPPKDPVALADAIERLYRDRELADRIGKAAQRWATDSFDQKRNSGRVLAIYRRVLARAAGA